jgi:hypothetical protein
MIEMCGNQGDGGGNSIELAGYRLKRGRDEMIHAEIRALYNYWDRLRAGRPCPYRAEIDPRDMAGDPRYLFVIEALEAGNVRFRLAGSALLDAIGYDLRGMSARSIMAGQSRESFVALIDEILAETGIGYARLLAPDRVSVWEVLLLPLRSNFGRVDRLIGCLHPVSGRVPEADPAGRRAPLRFVIEEMSIRPVEAGPATGHGDTAALPGFAEGQAGFEAPRWTALTPIEGGRKDGAGARPAGDGGGKRPRLRVVKTDE